MYFFKINFLVLLLFVFSYCGAKEENSDDIFVINQKTLYIQSIQQEANSGDKKSQYLLGYLYTKGVRDIQIDYSNAFYWFSKAADQNSKMAQWVLGDMHRLGIGTFKNTERSKYWYEQSRKNTEYNLVFIKKMVSLNDKVAQYTLGQYYIQTDKKEDIKKAIYWFEKSANQGYIEAQVILTFLYLSPRTSGASYIPKGLYWYGKSVIQSFTN